MTDTANTQAFTEEQTQYLAGFMAGAGIAQAAAGMSLPVLNNGGGAPGASVTIGGPDAIHHEAMARTEAAGGKLCKEELAKREKNALDMWDEMVARAGEGAFPKGTDVFLTKFHGMFYVAPAQDSYMCRLRFHGGVINTHQLRGVADLAEKYGGGYTHVTTRANLQIREIGPSDPIHVLTGLADLGVINRGSGGDNLRNITASPTAGIDPQELIDTRPLAKAMHHHILNHRELYGLPRKFNIAFDGGGIVSAVADTNDISFIAVQVEESTATDAAPAGVYFRMGLGGITGHQDFARDTGVLLKPDDCVPIAEAVIRVFIKHGDRTDRKKARLKYLLDKWGFEKFMEEVRAELGERLTPVTFPLESCTLPQRVDAQAHIGVHPQKQDGMSYVGVVVPVGRLTCEQMRAIAAIADTYGSGDVRMTVWQNVLIPDVPGEKVDAVKAAIEAAGLDWRASSFRAGLIACTGNAGCKFAASDTKSHAMAIAEHVEARLELDTPINIHLTGCHHSCAQHYIGDIGLLGANVERGDDMVQGYHVYLGGGYGPDAQIAKEVYRDVAHDELPVLVERMVRGYLSHRAGDDELFRDFTRRHAAEELREMFAKVEIDASTQEVQS
ncbi:MAG: NirA family protein [Phycisphaera sp.]|nr:NirA family protein [Phycisphaera sp.]